MKETAPAPVRPEDIEAAEQLLTEATSTTDVATLREMLIDQNAGTTEITAEDGTTIEVKSIGQEKFAELGQKATENAFETMALPSESWRSTKS
jgi:hypothetical protein